VIELFQQFHPPLHADCHLTPHETRLLKLLIEGHNYKTAAKEVGSSIHAVSFHMRNIYEKLQVHSKSEAVAKALRLGIAR
jgi:DNA-binding CsgD family transcriptional regulator